MAVSTYAELQTAVAAWMEDASVAALIPEFIALAEAEFNRVLRATEQEEFATLSAAGETVALPAGFKAMRALSVVAAERIPLTEMSLQALRRYNSAGVAGRPERYAIARDRLYLAPSPETAYDLECVYLAGIEPLSDANPTNWLLTAHPDLYCFGALLQGEFYGWNDSRLPMIKGRVDEIIAQINEEAKAKRHGVAPIRMRHGVRE